MMNKISTVVLDWAGTAVDFGCFAPVDAFAAAFEAFGIVPTIADFVLNDITELPKLIRGLNEDSAKR
ncbi:MAG: hypothetical protein LBS67_01730 [Clostridiales Family XIII bacterium]|nr:hypothetical protein [Clostridiales Family XIII bacterium]